MASGGSLFLLLSFFFPDLANILCNSHGIWWCTGEPSPCEPNCIESGISFPAMWKWCLWESVLGEKFTFLRIIKPKQDQLICPHLANWSQHNLPKELELSLTWSQEGTLLRYPVARTIASISSFSPLISSAWPHEILLIPGTTLISPDLIFFNAPISSTGVFPIVFLSANGPIDGLFSP